MMREWVFITIFALLLAPVPPASVQAAAPDPAPGPEPVSYALDSAPEIQAADRYFSLEDARNGRITEAELLAGASAEDREDGRIAAGVHGSSSFVLADYRPQDFTGLEAAAIVTVRYRAADSAGHIVTRTVRVYVTDTAGSLRFISLAYLDASEAEGGLRSNSVWRTGTWYQRLRQALTDCTNFIGNN